jgi:hypothetical protein
VIKTCKQSLLVLNEFSDFNRIVNLTRNYFIDVKEYLNSQVSNCSSSLSNFTDEGMKIDEKLRECQNQLLNLTAIALEKVNISLNTVSSSKKVQAGLIDSKSALRSLFKSLNEQKSCDDYDTPKLTWPRIVS